MSSDTAFVAGATGYTGRAVVAELRRRGITTHAHIRPGSSRRDELGPAFESAGAVVDQTPWEGDAFATTIARVEPTLVFSLLGITRSGARREAQRTGGPAPTYESVDYGLTKLLLDAVAGASPDARFVYLSSTGTSGSTSNAYLQVRWRCEEAIRAAGVPHTIARPSFISGPERDELRVGERVGAVAADALLGLAGALGAKRLRDRYRSIDNDGLARALVSAAIDDAHRDRVLEADALQALARG